MRNRAATIARLVEPKHIVTGLVAVVLAVTALQYGGYGNQYTSELALLVWVVLLVGIGTTVLPRSYVDLPGVIAIVLILGLTGITALSIIWASDIGRAFSQTILMLGVSGVFLLVIFTSKRGEGRAWLEGLTIGLGLIVLLAALSRYFPLIGDDAQLSEALGPIMSGRLSWPLGYWNATGTVAVMFILLMLWQGSNADREKARRLSISVIPAAIGILYLTASRGGFSALTIGFLMLIAFGPNRRHLTVSAILASLAGLPIILLVSNLGAVAHAADNSAAYWEGLLFLGASLLFSWLTWYLLPVVESKTGQLKFGRRAVIAGLAAIGVAAVVLLIASDPVERISEFTAIPFGDVDRSENQAFAAEHLLSANGSGRWQLWDAALSAFGTEPVRGIGAGGYEAYFKQFGDYWMKAVDAHSLPFQVLAELGLLGFLALTGFAGVVVWQTIARLRVKGSAESPDPRERSELVVFATLLAVGSFSISVDWTGQFPVIFGTLLVCSAMLVGPAYGRTMATSVRRQSPARIATAVILVLVAGAAVFFSTRAYQAASGLESSREATRAGDGLLAVREAQKAVSATPWDGASWAAVASTKEDLGDLSGALASATEATRRTPDNEDFWLLRAGIESKMGLTASWVDSMATAFLLDPHSAYWTEQAEHTRRAHEAGTPDIGMETVFNEAFRRAIAEADQ